MAKYTGTVRKNDLEGGFWELETPDGQRYQLRGGDAGLRVEGQSVEVDGKVDKHGGGFGIGMTSAYLDVSAWSKASG
jgi:hypothetical protein